VSGKKRVAILISGRGSNMSALIQAAQASGYPCEIVGVLSSTADAGGLESAARHGITTAWRSHKDFADRDSFDAELHAVLEGWQTEIVALAGFMRLLTPGFTRQWMGRMINIHPALLPSFKGLHTHEQALAAGITMHGCTVHFVTPGMDEGQAIAQAAVPVLPGDTPNTLGARVLAAEHALYPRALAALATGQVRLEGDKVVRAPIAQAASSLIWPQY
jgi:phosphoribosylglycinamide formyltransferase 1